MSNLETAKVLAAAGLIRPVNPLAAARAVAALRSWGVCLAGGFTAAALRSPRRIAVSDERGTLTFAQLDQRSNALADSLRRLGVEPGVGSRSCAVTIAVSSRRSWPLPNWEPMRCC